MTREMIQVRYHGQIEMNPNNLTNYLTGDAEIEVLKARLMATEALMKEMQAQLTTMAKSKAPSKKVVINVGLFRGYISIEITINSALTLQKKEEENLKSTKDSCDSRES